MASLLIRDALLLPMDSPDGDDARPVGAVRRASMRIRDGVITEIGTLTATPGEASLDANGLVALPGFVQVHLHYCQTLFRGIADDLPLMQWLQQRIWPLEHAHDAASTRASARLSIVDLLRGGTTTVQVMESVRHAEASFAAAAESGMTTVMGNCLMDLGGEGVPAGMVTTATEALRLADELRRAFHGQGRLHYAVSPRFVLSCSEPLSRDAAAFAAQHDLRVHTHACEHPEEVTAVRQALGRDYVLALREQGLLGPRTGLAHCVHTSAAERAVLAATDTAVLHCPSTNLKLGSGIAPVADYHRLGLRVGIGADGAPCNNRLSALTELRQAALLQALVAGPGAWPAAAALRAATLGGAAALGLQHELGSLQVGKRGDVVLLDLADLAPGGDVVSQVAYSATDAHIRHVVLGGARVVDDGTVQAMDAAAVRAEAAAALAALRQRASI